ncbi:MAG: DUF4340 domain-containing protein [Sedimenticolaceae bacterium]
MNRWTQANLVLAACALVLLAIDRWPVDSAQTATLTDLSPTTATALRVERDRELRFALERESEGWRLVHPRLAAADQHRVAQLLAVARAPVLSRFPAGPDLAQFGLDRPTAVLQIDDIRLTFGDRDPTQHYRYVLFDDEVRVIDDVYFNLLSLPAQHFVNP